MAIRKPRTVIAVVGATLLLTGIVTGWFSLDAALRHANIGSYPPAVWSAWVARNPMSDWDRFWVGFPFHYLIFSGVALLVLALIWAIVTMPKYVSPQFPSRPIAKLRCSIIPNALPV